MDAKRQGSKTWMDRWEPEDETFWGKLTAIGFVASLPILVMLAFFQRFLVRGFSGGLK